MGEPLHYPYSFEDRHPVIVNRVFYAPSYYQGKWNVLKWENPELFGNDFPVHIEYCSGNGEWIIDKAMAYPEINWVAVEKKFDRVRKIYAKREKRKLTNLSIMVGYAETITQKCMPSDSVDAIYINFPDPWPKKRHAKNRLIQEPFVREMARIMAAGGKLKLVTDDKNYVEQMKDHIGKVKSWGKVPFLRESELEYGTSYFDRLWRLKGREIHFLCYQHTMVCAS